ncbi:hypothetical protein [Bacteroides acidifaciens]|jgi:hypothetical protein|uniref:hypothetical protein n=1 Tax=Bacteroides acidifaciens TaxID=85831 RepID=UPI0025709655|nr:hypothetical protein [Bacteroides acidifaciens]
MRKKFARLLFLLAQKLCPDNPISSDIRTLPEGYAVRKLMATHSIVLGEVGPGQKFRPIPSKENLDMIRHILFHKLSIELQRTPEVWPMTAQNGKKPGDISVFTATMYVGIDLRAKQCREIRERLKKLGKILS